MTGPATDPQQFRVSDDERGHVLALLEKATGRGLIDLAEYTYRSEQVVAAKTRADLNLVLVDLPGLTLAGRSVRDAARVANRREPSGPGYSGAPASGAPAVMELTGWGSRSFQGHWLVPAHIVVGGFGASTRLGGVLDLHLTGSKTGGSINIRYPRQGLFGHQNRC